MPPSGLRLKWLMAALLIALVSAAVLLIRERSELMTRSSHWANWAEVIDAGFDQSGWLPASLPLEAHDISEEHNLDTNDSSGAFLMPTEAAASPAGVHVDTQALLNRFLRQAPSNMVLWLQPMQSVVFTCEKRCDGADIVVATNRESGHGAFISVVDP